VTTKRKLTALLIPFQIYCAIALLGLLLCRTACGYEVETPLGMFLAWSSIASSVLWLIGAAVQAHFRFAMQAGLNALAAIASILAVAHLMPYLAK